MPIEKRSTGKLPSPGPFLAEITNHLDPSYMGSLEVSLIKGVPNPITNQSDTYIVKYLSPFYGVTSVRFEGTNSSDFNDVQKSYGMWMVPPDIGTTVMVIFIDGDPNQGYWFGCVQDTFQNHMVPGIAASKQVNITPEQERKYGTNYLPVAEFNKSVQKLDNPNPDRIGKPVHPFAERLLAQGLLLDTVRGVTSSSARREVPSGVFGISTPGPLDSSTGAKRGEIGYDVKVRAPVSRLGGSTFVMDDGDINGQNELVRIRTRTGHQILLHNSHDLIYIANSKGTAWIELTSNGKIDVYAEDSVSIHTQQDFNLKADRDFNLEAGRNFNIAAGNNFNLNVNQLISVIGDESRISISGNNNLIVGGNCLVAVSGNVDVAAGGTTKHASTGKFSIGGDGMSIGSAGNLSLLGQNIVGSAERIDFNGPGATPPDTPDAPESPEPLNLYSLPQRDPSAGWGNGNFYKTENLLSIMQRVPTHEPWDQHENIDVVRFSPRNTDTTIAPTQKAQNGAVIEGGSGANETYPAKNGPAGDRGTVNKKKFSWSTDQPFLTKVKSVAEQLGFNPIDLLAIMNLETGRTFDPAITNNLGYTGLIQFGTDSASRLGTTTSVLRGMSRVEQMDYVYKYFHNLWGWPNSKCPNPTLVNLYLTVLLPAFRFAPADQKIADATDPKSASWYKSNPSFDPSPKKGYFTPAMVEATVAIHKREVLQCLSNAGVGSDLIVPPQPGVLYTGSDGVVTDSSGNSIKVTE
jgi:hypothetical protein